MSFETIYIDMLFESHLRHLIRHLLIEAKADVLQARHPHIDVHALAALDPTKTKKYLDWMVNAVSSDNALDIEELGSTIKQFHSAVQRLQDTQRDINTYKSLSDLQAVLSDVGTTSKTKQKQSAKTSGSQHVGNVDGWDVYFITSHRAAQLLGKGTKWCITQDDGTHWNDYIQKVKFFYALRGSPQGDPLDKIAYACYLNTDQMEVFDAEDHTLESSDTKHIHNLTGVIYHLRTQYNNYVINEENMYIKVVDDIVIEKVIDDGQGNKEWYKNGVFHREDGPAIEDADGSTEWYINGRLHREGGPAVEEANGTKQWWLNGKRHREGGPAVEVANGTKKWYLNGVLHREDGPAVEWDDGSKAWYVYGQLHRKDGPAVEEADGSKIWYKYDEKHREGGPAVESWTGTKEWYINDKLHREDGPAVELANGRKEWYLNGKQHRKDGPAAVSVDGSKEWWFNNLRHRDDGPAVERSNGDKEWWIYGEEYYSQEEYKKALKRLV